MSIADLECESDVWHCEIHSEGNDGRQVKALHTVPFWGGRS